MALRYHEGGAIRAVPGKGIVEMRKRHHVSWGWRNLFFVVLSFLYVGSLATALFLGLLQANALPAVFLLLFTTPLYLAVWAILMLYRQHDYLVQKVEQFCEHTVTTQGWYSERLSQMAEYLMAQQDVANDAQQFFDVTLELLRQIHTQSHHTLDGIEVLRAQTAPKPTNAKKNGKQSSLPTTTIPTTKRVVESGKMPALHLQTQETSSPHDTAPITNAAVPETETEIVRDLTPTRTEL